MDKVQEMIDRRREGNLKRAKRNYALAKELGLDSYHAGAISQWSEKRIREYAEQKKRNA